MTFEVIGKIKGKARPRLGKYGTYTPQDTINYENLIKISFLNSKGVNLHNKPIKMKIKAIFEPPKSISKKRREILLQEKPVTKKPDMDNIAKVVADALNKIAYDDDSQVYELNITKVYGVQEKLIVTIDELEEIL